MKCPGQEEKEGMRLEVGKERQPRDLPGCGVQSASFGSGGFLNVSPSRSHFSHGPLTSLSSGLTG